MRPKHRRSRLARWAVVPIGLAVSIVLAGCTQQQLQGFLPGDPGVTNHTGRIIGLWTTSWIVLLAVGVVTWGLIIWAAVAYRRRKGQTGLPVQLRYNLPIEIFYTIVPLILVLGFFAFTARDTDRDRGEQRPRGHDPGDAASAGRGTSTTSTRDVYSRRHPGAGPRRASPARSSEDELPVLYLPVGKRVEINIESRDVIHSFWIIDFLYKKDMIPAKSNYMYFIPLEEGTYHGKCAELCGEYHSLMLFTVKVVSEAEFENQMQLLRDAGNEGQLGPEYNTNSNLPGNGESTDRQRSPGSEMSTATAPARSAHDDGVRHAVGRAQGQHLRQVDHHDRPQDDRLPVPDQLVHLLHGRRRDGAHHARPALRAGTARSSATGEQYNQLFTMHGTIMLLMFATPLFAGFANVAMPLQIGAPDVAFPRLNAFAYWLYLFGAIITVAGFFTPQGAASFGWFAYSPLSNTTFTPGVGGNLWVFGLALAGFGTILGAVNFITTIITMRAPGMTMFRMPIFTWNILVTSILVLLAFPVLAAGLIGARRGPRVRRHICSIPPTAEPCSGSTCSGSSGTPRCTSSRCRSSASSARCCRSSAASRSSATRR